MTHSLLLSAFSILTLATCQNQTMNEKPSDRTNSMEKSPASTPVPQKSSEPEMSVGLPPDPAAVETAKKEQQKAAADRSGIIYFNEGENKFVKEYEMNVTFKRMIEDSRCPEGVNCVWAGVAVAEVELMGLYTRPVTVRLSTMGDAQKGYAKSQEFNGNTVSLIDVTPQTTADKGFKALAGKYRIGLKISKGSSGNSAEQRTTTK